MDMSDIWFYTIVISFIIAIKFVLNTSRDYKYWTNRAIPNVRPNVLTGSYSRSIFKELPLHLIHLQLYKLLEPHSFGGFFTLGRPVLLIRDPRLIKTILVDKFTYFRDRNTMMKSCKEEPLSHTLFSTNGEEWKNLRIKLLTIFTMEKLKKMAPLMDKCAKEFRNVLQTSTTATENIEIMDMVSRYCTDVIGSCIFGTEVHSLSNPDVKFRTISKKAFYLRYENLTKVFFPKLRNLKYINKEVSNFFVALVEKTVGDREKNKKNRDDFIDSLISLKRNFNMEQAKKVEGVKVLLDRMGPLDPSNQTRPDIQLNINIMAAQCFTFFFGGLETSTSVLSFLLFEMAQNADIQSKLNAEIDIVLAKHKQKVTYEALHEMDYLEMVISETMRKYPPTTVIFRSCTQDYRIPNSYDVIRKGMVVYIPVYGLHMDERYYPNPEQFNPENFTEEACCNRDRYTYLPFGEGSRMCIGSKFAKMLVKIAVVRLMKDYKFLPSPKMTLPLHYETKFGTLSVHGGIWLQCVKRKGSS